LPSGFWISVKVEVYDPCMKKLLLGLGLAMLAVPIHFVSGCGSDSEDAAPANDGGTGNAAEAGGAATAGAACTNSLECGSRNCDQTTKVCAASVSGCKSPDDGCAANTDCCSGSCLGGKCATKQCTADDAACTSDGECCGGKCDAGKCKALSLTCKTSGNPCGGSPDGGNSECCSHLCKDGICAAPSFCSQEGDACSTDLNCCGGSCQKAAGATLGLCGAVVAAPGAGGCTTAGTVCGAGTTGGTLPDCGGECCSKSCRPFAATGVLVCQPPSGCHPTGELCQQDNDCCGAPGAPGSTKDDDGKTTDVHCSKAPGATVGRCDQGNACSAAGAICRLKVNSCDATDRCCSGTVQTHPLNCKQDALGIPRCTVASDYDCAKSGPPPAGTKCASSADCCGQPCVGNVCAGTACIQAGNACTTTADCCAGSPCIIAQGSTKGTCGTSGITTPPGGTSSSSSSSSGGTTTPPPPSPGSTSCAQYGQVCTQASDCCSGVPCIGGTCHYDSIVK
jgi:hypothetical protein